MFFKTQQQSCEWATQVGFDPDELTKKQSAEFRNRSWVRAAICQPRPATVALARRLVSFLGPFKSCLFLVTEFGVWPSSENLHLYYRLRNSYGDFRELHEAPGHHFMGYETSDLVTFVDLAIQFGWGGHLVTVPKLAYIFLSHDEWVRIESDSETDRIVRALDDSSISYEIQRHFVRMP